MVCTTRPYRLATPGGLRARCLSRQPSFGRIAHVNGVNSLLQLLTSFWSTNFLLPDAKLLYFAPHTTSHFATPGSPVPACGAVGNNPREASVRKQLLALLSMLGLAGWAAPAQAQAIKGKEDDKAQAESTIKSSKASTESNAQKVVSGHKGQV